MAVWMTRSKRKLTGGLIKSHRKRRKFDLGRTPSATTIGPKKLKMIKTRGGKLKLRLRATETANVLDSKTKKITLSKILNVIENRANPHFIRQKIITKGAIIKTELGDVRVTSRPGQSGVVNGILIASAKEEKKDVKKK